jgi:hypothetical protein
VRTLGIGILALAALLLPGVRVSRAQPLELPRADLSATVGAQSSATGESGEFYSHTHFDSGFYGSASAGWYWTEHLKSEIDFGGRTEGKVYLPYAVTIGGVQTFYTSDRAFSTHTVGIAQQYQFFHNTWFHPHLAAGANLAWERSVVHSAAAYSYDPITRVSRMVTPERRDPPTTEFRVQPFAQSGFKAYMTPRTFFRGDLRVAFHHGIDDVIVRFGFGCDF